MNRSDKLSLQPKPDESLDSILGGQVRVLQRKKGYRFSVDGVLLAHFLTRDRAQMGMVADLGTGCGLVAMLLAYLSSPTHIDAIELQPALADLAQRNVALNSMQDRIRVTCRDLRTIPESWPRQTHDWVVANPPYFSVAGGRVSTNAERALARHEVACTLNDLVRTMVHLVKPAGRLGMVYSAARYAELKSTLRMMGFEPKRVRLISSHQGEAAELVVLEAAHLGNGEPLAEERPLYLHKQGGGYGDEAHAILWGKDTFRSL